MNAADQMLAPFLALPLLALALAILVIVVDDFGWFSPPVVRIIPFSPDPAPDPTPGLAIQEAA